MSIVLPEKCVSCGHVGISGTDELGVWMRCEKYKAPQPKPPGPPCHWCGKESCGAAGGLPFCGEHLSVGMQHFAASVMAGSRRV